MFDFFMNYPNFAKNILLGMRATIIIAVLSAIFGLLLGTILAFFRASKVKPLRLFAKVYTDVLRGTPVILQLSIVYYVILGTLSISPLVSAVVAFSLNSAAYISEIIRSGIQSIDKGQVEAAETLGVSRWSIATDIVLPQAFRRTLPPLINELATLIKESSIVYIIQVKDIMYHADRATANTYTFFEPLLIASLCYYVLVKLLTTIGKKVEATLTYDDRS